MLARIKLFFTRKLNPRRTVGFHCTFGALYLQGLEAPSRNQSLLLSLGWKILSISFSFTGRGNVTLVPSDHSPYRAGWETCGLFPYTPPFVRGHTDRLDPRLSLL